MEFHMHTHHFTYSMPDWRAAAMAGLAFLVLELVLVGLIPGERFWLPPRMIAAMVFGHDALQVAATFEAGIMVAALVVHFVLAIVGAMILSLIIASFSFDSSVGMASLAGALFGLAVYLINFYAMTQFFPWLAEARNWVSVFTYLLFGVVVADTYLRLERKEGARQK